MSNKKEEKLTQKYIVSGYDSFDNSQFHIGSYDTLEEAVKKARSVGGQMTLVYVHDSKGNLVTRFGTF